MFLICSYFPDWILQCYKEECQTEYNKNTISFLSFFFFQAAHIGNHWLGGVLQKIGSASVLKPIKEYLRRSSIFHYSCRLQVCNFTKDELLHRYFSSILNTDAAVSLWISYFEEHIFKYFSRTSSMAASQYHFNTIIREWSKF